MIYFSSNLKTLRKRKKRSQEDMAAELGITRSSQSAYEVGNAEPNFDTLIRVSEYFKFPVDILLKEDLSSYSELRLQNIESGHEIDITGKKLRVLTSTVDGNNEENIELVPMNAKAGYTAGYADPEYIKILPTFQLPFLSKQKKYRTFPISGDSMPPVSNGSFVTAEYVQNWEYIQSGYPYIIITKDDGIVFKVVYNHIKDKKTLLLCSTNPEYQPYEISIGDILEVWKFTNYISSQLPEPNLSRDKLAETVLQLQKDMAFLKNKS